MNRLAKSKIALYLASIFVAGGITGTVIGWSRTRRQMNQAPSMDTVCSYMEDRLKTKLALTPEQFIRIKPILEQTEKEMRSIHSRSLDEIDRAIQRANVQIEMELNENQKRLLQQMENERRDFMQKRQKSRPDANSL